MNKQSIFLVVMVTAKNTEEARAIADGLLNERLVACANIVDRVQSRFWWQGCVDDAQETLLLLKTKSDLFEQVITKVKSLHSYDTPEIIALPIYAGSDDYLNWINASVTK